MKINLKKEIRDFIDLNRGIHCRVKYILMCVSYIRDNNINLNKYYEGINNDRANQSFFGGKS